MAGRTANGATPTSGSRAPSSRNCRAPSPRTGSRRRASHWAAATISPPSGGARSHRCAGRAQLARGRQRRDVHDVPPRRGVGPAVHPHHQPLLRARRQDDRDPRADGAEGRARRAHPARGDRPQHRPPGEPRRAGPSPPRGDRGLRVPGRAPSRQDDGDRRRLVHGRQHQPRPPVLRPQRRAESGHLRSGGRAAPRRDLRRRTSSCPAA